MAAMIIITTAISPGKMKLRETMSVLNQTRGFSSRDGMRGRSPLPLHLFQWPLSRNRPGAVASAYPRAMVAVLGSLPSRIVCTGAFSPLEE